MSAVLTAQVASTWFMTGVIWFVQVVHYPLMRRVGGDGHVTYQAEHMRRTGWIVGPAMLIEAVTAALLLVDAGRVPPIQAWIGLGLVAAVWLSTALLQVPQHRILERGFDARAHGALVRGNWIRTALWTARASLVATWI